MIPQTVHRVWLGDRTRPAAYDRYWEEWQQLHPGWEFETWTDAAVDELPLHCRDVYEHLGRGARSGVDMAPARAIAVQRADILGYELLALFGGIYVNCDVQPLRSFEPLLTWADGARDTHAFAGWEDEQYLCNAVMGAEPGSPFFAEALDRITLDRLNANRQMEVATGPHLLTEVYRARGGDATELFALPREAFYWAHHSQVPYGTDAAPFVEPARAGGAYALHHWGHRMQEGDIQ